MAPAASDFASRWRGCARIGRRAGGRSVGEGQPARRLNWILADAARRGERRAVMIVVFGLSPDERQAVVTRLGERPAAAGIVPIYVTDSTDFEPFRYAHAYFEHLPLRRGGRADAGPAITALYAARRFQLLCDKWKPIRVVGFGPTAVAGSPPKRADHCLPPDIKTLLATVDTDLPGVPTLPALGQA